jgi:hypothetical protein
MIRREFLLKSGLLGSAFMLPALSTACRVNTRQRSGAVLHTRQKESHDGNAFISKTELGTWNCQPGFC